MIIFIGDKESAKPYRLFGFETYEAETPEEAAAALEKIPEGASAVFVAEDVFPGTGETLRGPGLRPVAVPGAKGGTGAGSAHITEMLKKALGTDAGSADEPGRGE